MSLSGPALYALQIFYLSDLKPEFGFGLLYQCLDVRLGEVPLSLEPVLGLIIPVAFPETFLMF